MVTSLNIVSFEKKKWYFDERLSELRRTDNPHEVYSLNEFEVQYYKDKLSNIKKVN